MEEVINVVSLVLALLVLSLVSLVCGWWCWLRSPAKFPAPKVRSWVAFSGLLAGTLSTALPFLMYFDPFNLSDIARSLIYLGLGLAGVTLALSLFGRGKLRIMEMLMGLGMCPFWWEILQINK